MHREASDTGHHRTGLTLEAGDTAIGKPQVPAPRRRRSVALTGVAVAAVLLVAVLGTTILLNRTPPPRSVPAPQLFIWSHHAQYDGKTPQEAFAANVQLTPCDDNMSSSTGHGAPPETASVTWLDAGRDYGLALINVTCPPPTQPYAIWLFSLGRDDQHHWVPQAGYIGGVPQSGSTPPPIHAPSWLPSSADTYIGDWFSGPPGLTPPASVAAWYTASRTFVLGHVADPATRPADATSITLSGQAAWTTVQNSIVTVTVPQSDGTTIFFSGTSTAAQVQSLAASAFAHMGEVLAPLPQ